MNMSKAGCPAASAARRLRFKGVENFLKRVAFNLGNSPSQTEVKIISCIPIDVSDLQQKIICLEKQLEETKCYQVTNTQRVVNTAICDCPQMSNTGVTCNILEKQCNVPSHMSRCIHNRRAPCKYRAKGKIAPDEYYHPDITSEDDCLHVDSSYSRPRECKKNIFSRKNKCCKFKKPKTHYVYYAQTRSNPFHTTHADRVARKAKVMKRSYLAEMINKQYKPRALGGNLSDISNFSAPICRDTNDFHTPICYESDLCSCLHEGFHNIDRTNHNPYIIKSNNLPMEGGYYDSALYDVFPVREKSVKVKKSLDILKKKEPKPLNNVNNRTESELGKFGTYPINNSLYLNHNFPSSSDNIRKLPKINKREVLPLFGNIDKHRNTLSNVDQAINMKESKSCCINFENIQTSSKVISTMPKIVSVLKSIQESPRSDAECLANFVVCNDCQTETNTDDPNPDIKTENTLNQIKSILQSVLQEVKVAGVPKANTGDKVKKDVVIQKDLSQNSAQDYIHCGFLNNLQDRKGNVQLNMPSNIIGNMTGSQQSNMDGSFSGAVPTNVQASSFLNSFSYCPNNTNPCIPSSSKQLNQNPYHSTPAALKYFLNYPVYIQNPERHMCANCCRNNTTLRPQHVSKKATTTATNTDHLKQQSKTETHKLIKEIYKSMALNMNANNNKDISVSEVNTTQEYINQHLEHPKKEVEETIQNLKERKKPVYTIHAVSELFRKKDIPISSETPNSSIVNSEQDSIDVSIIYSDVGNEGKLRQVARDNLISRSEESQKDLTQNDSTATQNSETTTSVSETTSTETADGSVVSPPSKDIHESRVERKEKTGIFSKMFKSVFKQKEKKKRDVREDSVETYDTEEMSSDSDDYQTIYSQKIERPVKYAPRANNYMRHRAHSKISYKQAHQGDKILLNTARRSPYMEQEYRRQWNEKLMFHDQRYQHTSDSPTYSYGYSNETSTPFYQRYETRTALGQPKNPEIELLNAQRIMPAMEQRIQRVDAEPKMAPKRLSWLKNCKLKCKREDWKNVILKN